MKKNMKINTLMMMMVLFLLGGFVLLGATGTASIDDRTQADNDSQQRVLPQDMHLSRYSVRKPTKEEKKKALWRQAKCNASADLGDFFAITRESKKVRHPGTKLQKNAEKRFGIKTPPRQAAFLLAKDIYNRCHKFGDDSVQKVLNDEVEELLKYGTKRIKDKTYAVDYTLHVLKDLGGAFKRVFEQNGLAINDKARNNDKKITHQEREQRLAIRRKLTVNVSDLVTALKANKDILTESGYELQIKPYKHFKKTSVTPKLWHEMSFKSMPTMRAVANEVEKNFDSTTYNAIKAKYTAEALTEEAGTKLKLWKELYDTDMQELLKVCPEGGLFGIVKDLMETGTLIRTLQKEGVESMSTVEKVINLRKQFVEAYAEHMKTTMPVRSELLDTAVDKAITSKLRDIKKNSHSWEIMVTRQTRRNETEVTMLWHLSHMTEYKNAKNSVRKNNHTGARYLLGPSNGVTVPDSIAIGYVRALRDTSAGSRQFTGDTVSFQMILPNWKRQFTVTEDMKDSDVRKVMKRRKFHAELYTMINVGLGKNPKQPAHLVMGLYSDPALVKSGGQMTAPVLKTIKPQSDAPSSKPNKRKTKGKQQGPNTAKNTKKVNKAAKTLDVDANAATPEEVAYYSRRNESESPDYASMTNSVLKEYCRTAGLPVSGNKAALVERLNSAPFNVDGNDDVFDQLMTTGSASIGEPSKEPPTPKRVKKTGQKPVTPTRGRTTGKKSDPDN